MCCLRSIYGVLCRNIYISIHPHLYSYIYVCRHGYQLYTLLHFDNQLKSYTRLKPTQLKNMLITLVFVSSSNDTRPNMKLSATHFERVAFSLSDVWSNCKTCDGDVALAKKNWFSCVIFICRLFQSYWCAGCDFRDKGRAEEFEGYVFRISRVHFGKLEKTLLFMW